MLRLQDLFVWRMRKEWLGGLRCCRELKAVQRGGGVEVSTHDHVGASDLRDIGGEYFQRLPATTPTLRLIMQATQIIGLFYTICKCMPVCLLALSWSLPSQIQFLCHDPTHGYDLHVWAVLMLLPPYDAVEWPLIVDQTPSEVVRGKNNTKHRARPSKLEDPRSILDFHWIHVRSL